MKGVISNGGNEIFALIDGGGSSKSGSVDLQLW